MGISNSHPVRFAPKGVADAFDATEKFPGACRQLTNLVFDQANPELVVPRPGVTSIVNLAGFGFPSASFVSVHACVGSRIYGMVASTTNAGKDEPFCYDTATGTFAPMFGVTAANTPFSPLTTGDWIPPTISSVGVFLIVTHPGFAGTASVVGWIDISVPLVPTWSSGNLATNPILGIPTACANLNNRAYYAVGNQVVYSDVLLPKTRTNASQQLVIGDSDVVTALSGLPMQTTSSGIISALTVFKASQCWQVTGDTTTANLALNYVSLQIGTQSPRTISQSPYGLYFISTPGGPYVLDMLGTIRPIVHDPTQSDPDIQVPFQNAQTPSRWSGAYIASIYRVCGTTVLRGLPTVVDYWFDEHRRRWSGPHTFHYDCADVIGNYFVLSSASNPGLLMRSDTQPGINTGYLDIFNSYTAIMFSATFPKIAEMSQKQVCESMIELGSSPSAVSYIIRSYDERDNQMDGATINAPGNGGLLWGVGGALWGGGGLWLSGQSLPPIAYAVPWSAPFVFNKMAIEVLALAGPSLQIGVLHARYQPTGYMTLAQGT